MESGPHAALIVLGPFTDEASRFLDAVAAKGVVLGEIGEFPVPAPLVVCVTDAEAEDPPQAFTSDRDVLPVSFLDAFSAVLPDLSHLAPRVEGVDDAVDRLVRAIHVGGAALAGWERLVARARAWEQDPSSSRLLSDREQTEALSLLAVPPAHLEPVLVEGVRTYVAQSQRHSHGRRRRARSIVAVTLVLLALVTAVAGVQSVRAAQAARESTEAANSANARRLAADADSMTGRDPDVPLTLAAIATSLSDHPDVRNAVAGIIGTHVPHKSVALEVAPRHLVTSSSGRYAYSSMTDTVIRVTDPSGVEVASFPYAGAEEEFFAVAISLSPSGQRVVVASEERTPQVFDVETGQGVAAAGAWSGDYDTLIEWWDDERVLVGISGGLDLMNVDTGTRSSLIEASDGVGLVTDAALSPSRAMIVLTDGARVQVWDLNSERFRGEASIDAVTDLAVNDAGTVVFGARFPSLVRIDVSDGEATITEDRGDHASVGVEALAEGYFVGSDRRGRIAIYLETTGADPVARFQAHLVDSVRIAADPMGTTLGSVSLDGYLRIWQLDGLDLIGDFTVAGPVDAGLVGGSLDMSDMGSAAFPKSTLRHQVRVAGPASLAVSLVGRGGLLVDSSDAAETYESMGLSQIGIPGRVMVTADGGHMVRALYVEADQGFAIEIWPIDADGQGWGSEPSTRFDVELPVTVLGPAPFLVDVSDDGVVALASSSSLVSYDATGNSAGEEIAYRSPSPPLALAFDSDGVPAVLTSDGWLHGAGGSAVDLGSLVDTELATTIAAAEFDGELWLLTDSGAILRYASGELEVISQPATVTGEGTLRVSPDGARIAHMGANALTVLDSETGGILAQQPNPPGVQVDDVAFGDDPWTFFVVTEMGTLASWVLSDTPGESGSAVAPRPLTADEMLAFDVTEEMNG
ncbi:MAG: hypothetical protein EOL89_00005 [Actinobacteria bacterium]|nr:hypothetical protein [Actinomycetota bacterium]